jgi:hypothetical protein
VKEICINFLHPEEGGRRGVRNVDNHLPDYMVSPGGQLFKSSLLCKSHIISELLLMSPFHQLTFLKIVNATQIVISEFQFL